LDEACYGKGAAVWALSRHLIKVCPAQASTWTQKRERLENISLARTIGAEQANGPIACLKIKARVVPELR
jgi:hypothetical protein